MPWALLFYFFKGRAKARPLKPKGIKIFTGFTGQKPKSGLPGLGLLFSLHKFCAGVNKTGALTKTISCNSKRGGV